jgi:hypothetical protein
VIGDLAPIDVTGDLTVTQAGVGAEFSVSSPVVVGDFSFSGDVTIKVNTAGTPLVLPNSHRLPAGPYVRIDAKNITVSVSGVSLHGDFAIEQSTNSLGQKRTTIALSGIIVSIGGDDLLTNAGGVIILAPGGLAGKVSGTVDLSSVLPAGSNVSGTFELAINRTSQAVDETVEVGNGSVHLVLPKGPYVRVAGTNVQISILGQTLSGDFGFEQSSGNTTLFASNVTVKLGNGSTDFVTLTNGAGSFMVLPAGVAGGLTGTVTVAIPGVDVTGTFRLEINTSGSAQTVTIGGQSVNLENANFVRVKGTANLVVFGQKLSGTFAFEQIKQKGPASRSSSATTRATPTSRTTSAWP